MKTDYSDSIYTTKRDSSNRLSLLLTLRAKVCATLRHQYPPYACATAGAWLAGLLIDVVPDLKTSLPPVDVHIVGNGRPPCPDCFPQYLPDRCMELLHPIRPQPRRQGQGMNAGAKQRLVRIYISD